MGFKKKEEGGFLEPSSFSFYLSMGGISILREPFFLWPLS